MSQVIARRYRPQGFDEVIGQAPIVRTLRNAIESGRIAHGFIFSGHRGIGKTTVARILAKALNCRAAQGPTATPCGECDSCREIKDGSAVDVIEIDAASNRGIDEIRALRERVRYRPARDRYKFFILDEAHQLTGDAFNALLKTLEEPPEWAVFVLATTEPEALPATIRSRCQHFGFRAVPFSQILEHLTRICEQERVPTDQEALGLIAEAGEGSVRDALSLLDQAITHAAEGDNRLSAESVRALLGRVSTAHIRALLEAVASDSARNVLEQADTLLATSVSPAQLCWQLTQAVRNLLVAQAGGELLEVTESERASAQTLASRFREEELARFLQILLRCSNDLRHGQQERLHFELALIKMLHARRLSSVEEVLASLTGEGTPGAPAPSGPKGAPAAPRLAEPPRLPEPPKLAQPPKLAAPAGIPEFSAVAAAPAPSQAPPAPEPPAPAAPQAAVRAALERQGKAALLSIVDKAQWIFRDHQLELVFGGASAGAATLANQPATRKALAAACLAGLQRSLEVIVSSRADAAPETAPAAAAPPGSPAERAEQHPLLRQIKDSIPHHVLRTFVPSSS